MNLKKIKHNCIIPSSAFSVPKSKVKQYDPSIKKKPEIGDLIFGEIDKIGRHNRIESRSARLHTLNIGTRSIFVFGNRYSPDQYEGLVPDSYSEYVDLFSQGGVVGKVNTQNQMVGVPTKVRVLGYVCDAEGKTVNTKNHILVHPKTITRRKGGAKVILCIGSTMNSGKTHAAAACCYAISSKSGSCSSSPLIMREIKTFTELPILQSMEKNYKSIFKIIE